MRNRSFLLMTAVSLAVSGLLFSGCQKNESEPWYEGYGSITNLNGSDYRIRLDNGFMLIPEESPLNPDKLKDSMRLHLSFNILEERQDSTCNVEINWAREILTKPILPYEEAILDSIGNDPIRISNYWITYGFLNFEFIYSGADPAPSVRHMVNLLSHPANGNLVELEFRHNAFNDQRDRLWSGVVSFPIESLIKDLPRPITLRVKTKESATVTKTIDIVYK